MKTLKNLFAILAMGALVLTACKNDAPTPTPSEPSEPDAPVVDPTDPDTPAEEEEFPEIMPVIDEPAADSVTIAIYVPSNTCNGVILTGNFDEYKPGSKLHPFAKLEGEDRWYTITMPYAADFAAKAIALTAEGVADWGTQWGMNIPDDDIENVVILGGEAVLTEENGGEQKLTAVPAGTVVYIGIKAWKAAPCVERNKAGTALFTANVGDTFPAEAILGVVGKINEEQNWNNDNPLLLTKGEGNVWTLETEVFDACEYKYRASLDGGATWIWPNEGNNIQMPLDLKPVDNPTFTFAPAAE